MSDWSLSYFVVFALYLLIAAVVGRFHYAVQLQRGAWGADDERAFIVGVLWLPALVFVLVRAPSRFAAKLIDAAVARYYKGRARV